MTTSPEPEDGAGAESSPPAGPEEVVEGPEEIEVEAPPRSVGSRREARERAITLLYEAEARSLTPSEVIDAQPIDVEGYAGDLVIGVGDHQPAIDAVLDRLAVDWEVDRMPAMDRAVLRMACFELGHRPDVPTNVILNEAVDLAKAYGTDDSGRFVNGVLATLAQEVRQ